jgi:ankyrin repeat protein
MVGNQFRLLIEHGDVDGMRHALEADPALANRTVHWHLNRNNESDPLHYVSDCIGHGWLKNGTEGLIAKLLLEFGAELNGTLNRESPLIASTSLGAERVSRVLIKAGADIERTSVYESRALHWAAWMGASATVALLIERGAQIEIKDAEFGSTPLFWAVHGYGPNGTKQKRDQVGAASKLIDAGADPRTTNKWGLTALELAKTCESMQMYELLNRYEKQ